MWVILGKIIVATGLKKLPKVQKIAQSGHTGCWLQQNYSILNEPLNDPV